MLQAAVRADLWDIEQQQPTAFVDCVHGQVGFNRVTVPVLVGPTTLLRLHAFASPHWFSTRGGLCFQPERAGFSATRLKPVVAEWLKSRDPLGDLAETAERSNLPLSAELTCRHLPALTGRFPQAAAKNCFGEPVEHRACLNNPDVREFLIAVVGNLCQTYNIRSLVLRHLVPDVTQAPGCFGLDPVAAWLLAQCFCESCRQQLTAAGLDSTCLARRACTLLESTFASGGTGVRGLDELLDEDADLRAFDAFCTKQIVALLQAMSRRSPASLTIEMPGARPSCSPRAIRRSGLSLRWSYPCFERSAEGVSSLVDRVGETAGLGALTLRFSMTPRHTPDAPTLVRVMTLAAEAGVRSVQIDGYGTTPVDRLDWMRQALRSATRAAR